MKLLLKTLSVPVLIILIFWSLNIRDPHLLFMRHYEFWVIAFLAVALSLLSFFLKPKLLAIAVLSGSVASLLISCYTTYAFTSAKSRFLNNPTGTIKEFNKRIIVGFEDWNEIRQLSGNGIAGIFLTARNVKNTTREELKRNISNLQKERRELGLPPLLVATDQEGGSVSRLSPLIARQKPLAELANKPNCAELAYAYGDTQGKALADLGVNLNFSPVVDLKPEMKHGFLDFHTHIATRAISTDPQQVVAIAKPYIHGVEKHGVLATLKHFPGLARVATDTHHFSALLKAPVADLAGTDWIPFIVLGRDTNAWIMLSHVVLTGVDSENPVSVSKQVVDGLIRRTLGFEGALVTDDLTMGAAYNRGFCKSVEQSYGTSVNYLLIAYDYEKYYDAIACLESRSRLNGNPLEGR